MKFAKLSTLNPNTTVYPVIESDWFVWRINSGCSLEEAIDGEAELAGFTEHEERSVATREEWLDAMDEYLEEEAELAQEKLKKFRAAVEMRKK